ncbi:hypothetical protein [Thaumasiovibrio subtropicus]|uniref:hypothetical protein n=1 Tax=Thaumasiovibrio subtropicus TaxID=1891207 RepID=UPI001FE3457E|nr:hypothetical protein [Thaumasiovibrio subtropicus]
MYRFGLLAVCLALVGCAKSVDQRADEYLDVSYQLCAANVKAYSHSDDGKIRIICEDDSFFLVKDEKTLEMMHELNGAYCTGQGFKVFHDRKSYYTFTCSNERQFNIPK